MKYSLSSLCLVLSLFSPSCSGQNNSMQRSCISPNINSSIVPPTINGSTMLPTIGSIENVVDICGRFYNDGDHYYSRNVLSGLQVALSRIYLMFQSESNPCVDFMLNFLCYYYFPLCNPANNKIIPVCNRSCILLGNNEDYSALRASARTELQQDNIIPPDEACIQTHRNYVNNFTVSENCFSIENTSNETLPLRCTEIPDETCSTLLQQSFYAPGLFLSADERTFQITPFDLGGTCQEFANDIQCFLTFPPCNPTTGTILPICAEACSHTEMLINQCLTTDNLVLNQTLSSFECLEPQSYLHLPLLYIETDPDQCIFGEAAADSFIENDDDFAAGAIIGSVLGGFFVVVIVVIIIMVLLIRRNRIKRSIRKQKFFKENIELSDGVRYIRRNDNLLGLDINYTNNSPSPLLIHRRIDLQGNDTVVQEVNNLLDYVKHNFSEIMLPVNTITKQDLLGKGAFGVVHKGEWISSSNGIKAVAIKSIKSCSLGAMKDLVAESAIMKTFHHPNVLPLLGVCIDYNDQDMLKIIMPFMANGDLKTFLKDSRITPNNTQEYPKDLSEEVLMRMCFDIAKGMEYLAQKRFIHRDLAGRNCMVDTLLTIKIADFGLTKDVYSTEYYRVDKHITLPVKWMSLESLLDGYFDEKTDVWSYGITCWEIFSLGRLPYPGVDNANIITLLKSGKRLEKPELCPSEMNEITESTWLENPDERPTFSMIVQKLSSICNFTESTAAVDAEDYIEDIEDTAKSSDYITVT